MTKECMFCGAGDQDGKFCEECGEQIKAGRVQEDALPVWGNLVQYRNHTLAVVVPILAVGVLFLFLSQGTTPASAAEVDTAPSDVIVPVNNVGNIPGGETRTLVTSIQGMTCGGCVAGIERKVGGLNGIVSVDVFLGSKSGNIVYDPSVIDKQTIINTITTYGYPTTEVSDTVTGEEPTSPTLGVVAPTAQPSVGGGSCTGGAGGGGCGCGG